MEIPITVACYKAAKSKLGDELPNLFTSKKKDGDTLTLPLFDLGLDELLVLASVLKSYKDESYNKVAKLCKSLKDPNNKKIEDLKEFPNMLRQFLKEQEFKTLHSLHSTLRGVAYLPFEVEYFAEERPTRGYNGRPAFIKFTLVYNSKRGYSTDTLVLNEKDAFGTVPEILRRLNLMAPDAEMVEDYEKVKKRYIKFSDMHGEMFECKSIAHCDTGSYWYREDEEDLTIFGKPSKAVLDTEHGQNKHSRNYARNTVHSPILGQQHSVPYHPVLPMFSLVHHKMFWVNVGNMRPYDYDDKVQDKLILPETHRRLVKALVTNMDALRDTGENDNESKILKSKASSSIILAYGPPGTGKTLTAEVYAETINRPLYEVQSAQIGTSPEDVESNLRMVLQRSLRLKMPLLINEADAFVAKRGISMEQDAIVAVFLRLLEYHTGLVFLTSNREQDIDDAIKSRCIALIHFAAPERKERLALWKIQLEQFGLELTKPDLLKAVDGFPTIVGRDIQNLIKLTHRVCQSIGTKFSFEELRHNATFRGIEVLSDAQIEAVKAARASEKA